MKTKITTMELENAVVYYPEEIPDLLSEKIERLSQEAATRKYDEKIEKRRIAQEARNIRIEKTNEDERSHAIATLLEYAELAKDLIGKTQYADNGTTFPIQIYSFNFEDTKMLKGFLNRLQEARCFESYAINPYKDNDHAEYIFKKVKIDALQKYKKQHFDTKHLKPKDCFECFDLTFQLHAIDKSLVCLINFYPREGETSNTYCLMSAYISYLKKNGIYSDGKYVGCMPKSFFIKYIQTDFPKLVSNNSNLDSWLKSTKPNLIRKIPQHFLDLIRLDDFDRKQKGFPISLAILPTYHNSKVSGVGY